MLCSDYDIRTQWPEHRTPPPKHPTVLRTDRVEVIDPSMSLLSDSKGVYDALNNEQPQGDKKISGGDASHRGGVNTFVRQVSMDPSQL